LYIQTSVDKTQFYQRLSEITVDTAAVNILAEVGQLVGLSAAGAYANEVAKKDNQKMEKKSRILNFIQYEKKVN
jgi:hypothetical protein